MRGIQALIAVLFAFSTAYASNAPLRLDADADVKNVAAHMYSYLDASQTLTIEEMKSQSADWFTPITSKEPNFGHTEDAIWLKLPVQNASAETMDWILWLETNFMYELSAYIVSDAQVTELIQQTRSSTFDSRKVRHPNLIAHFSLEGNESAEIYIRYRSQGNTHLPIRIESPDNFIKNTHQKTARLFIFYGATFVFILISLGSFLLLRKNVYLFYGLYALSVLFYIMHRDGYTFQYFWPNAPAWNNFASHPLGVLLPFFAAQFTRSFLQTKKTNIIADWVLKGYMAVSVALLVASFWVPQSTLKMIDTFWVMWSAMTFLVIGIVSWFRQKEQTIFFVLGWAGVVGASVYVAFINTQDIDNSRAAMMDIIRMAMVLDASMMGLALVDGYNRLRKQRDRSNQDRMAALESNLSLYTRLNALEQRYTEASAIADARGKALADASHDIRQPLFALRASICSLLSKEKGDPEHGREINTSLHYLEGLLDEYLSAAIAEEKDPNVDHLDLVLGETQVQVVFDAVYDMFAREAEAKGLDFSVITTSRAMTADAMRLLRITCNLVANAIRYTEKGGVVVGCRLKNGRPGIEVVDTGRGMDEIEAEAVMERTVRGSASGEVEGSGLGFSIIQELAKQDDLRLIISSVPGSGTRMRIEKA